MAFGSSFASFVNGYVGGRDIRHKWEDRASDKERQKVLDGYEAERQRRLGETHGWDRDRQGVYMASAADADRLRDQAWTDDQSIRTAVDADLAAQEASGALGIAPSSAPAGQMNLLPVSQPGPIEQAAATIAPMGASPDRSSNVQPIAADSAAAVAPATAPLANSLGISPDTDPLLMDRGDGTVVALRGPRSTDEQRAIAEAAKTGRLVQDDAAAARQRQIDAAGTSRQQEGPVARTLRRNEDHEWGLPGGAVSDMAEAAKLPARGAISLADAAANVGARGIRQVNRPVNAISKWLTGKDFGEPSNVDALNRNAPDFPGTQRAKEDGKALAPAETETAAAVAEVVDNSTAAPAASEALTELGVKPGTALSPAQIDRASTQMVRSYREQAMPATIRELMRQGKFTEAESLRTFVNDAATQEGMKAWSGAVFAAISGDVDTAASKMIDLYNDSQYFPDGFEVVRDQTELSRGEGGEVVGLKLARRNLQTGEVITETGDVSDLIQRGLWLLSPEQAAVQYMAQQQAMQTRLIEMDAERRKAGADLIHTDHEYAMKAAVEAYKGVADPISGPKDEKGQPLPVPTWEEFLAERFGQGSEAQADPVPMLRRPQ